jgi:ferredoxin
VWRVRVDKTCIGSGSCVGVAPTHFVMGEDRRSHPRVERVQPDEAVLDAVASCPVEAITVIDQETGEVIEV